MKRCTRCKKDRLILSFNFKNKKTGRRQPVCKFCTRKELRERYQNNKQYYINKAKRWNINNIDRNKTFVYNYLRKHSCLDCGEKNIVVLQFDHQRDKCMNIGTMIHRAYSLDLIKIEIEKCEVRCANCHLIKTAQRGQWDKNTFLSDNG